MTQVVPVIRRAAAGRDSRDNKLREIALAGEAAPIISGDTDLLVLNPWHGIPIGTPADYLTIHRVSGTPPPLSTLTPRVLISQHKEDPSPCHTP